MTDMVIDACQLDKQDTPRKVDKKGIFSAIINHLYEHKKQEKEGKQKVNFPSRLLLLFFHCSVKHMGWSILTLKSKNLYRYSIVPNKTTKKIYKIKIYNILEK